jgi:hypothetical protein
MEMMVKKKSLLLPGIELLPSSLHELPWPVTGNNNNNNNNNKVPVL